jgi:ABC-type glutathione transport system ATPase component
LDRETQPAGSQAGALGPRKDVYGGSGGRSIGQLSGGEQQRVLLARALAQDTPVLLLDEPTAHLDLRHQSGLLNLVQELAHEQRLAVLMALHDLNLVALYSDRVALLVDGCLKTTGSPEDVLTAGYLSESYQVPLSVTVHPEYGTPLILPDGRNPKGLVQCHGESHTVLVIRSSSCMGKMELPGGSRLPGLLSHTVNSAGR